MSRSGWLMRGNLLLAACLGLMVHGAASAQEVPFAALVHEDLVTVRSGAGRAYYAVGDLKKGDIVTVVEVFHGWNKIIPPEGVYSYISKGFVNAKGDGKTGVVNRDRAEVKAANTKGPGQSYRGQIELNEGDTVSIVGEESSYYKIVPPKGAFVFLEPGAVRKAEALEGATEPAEPEVPAEPTTPRIAEAPVQQPEAPVATETPDTPETPETPAEPSEGEMAAEPTEPAVPGAPTEPEKPQVTEVADATKTPQTPAETIQQATDTPEATEGEVDLAAGKGESAKPTVIESSNLAEFDKQTLPLFELPLEEQPIDAMIAGYSKFKADPNLSSTDRRVLRLRLAALEHNKKVLTAIHGADAALADIEKVETAQPRVRDYDAIGILRASSVYNGTNLPRMYRLVDPTTERTTAYVSPTGGKVDPSPMLGKVVGIVGKPQYDQATKLSVIEVEQIVVLEPGE